MRRTLVAVLIGLLLVLGAYLILRQSPEPGTPSEQPRIASVDQVLHLPILSATSISTLDPILSVEIAQYDLCNQIFEGLVKVDADGDIAPALAEHWEHSADFRVWKFFLRDVRFADDSAFADGRGRTVTVDDVIFSLKRGLSPEEGSKGSFALSRAVLGAKAYSEGEAPDVAGIRSPRAGVIEIELAVGDRYFPAALTVPATYVTAPEAVSAYGPEFGLHPVGTGPFKLDHWTQGKDLRLVRNENYGVGTGHQPKPPDLDVVEYYFYRSEARLADAFAGGEIDVRPVLGTDLATAGGGDWKSSLLAVNPDANVVEPGWILKLHLLAPQMGGNHPFGGDGLPRRALAGLLADKIASRHVLRGIGKLQVGLTPDRLVAEVVRPTAVDKPEEVLRNAVEGREVRVAYASTRINDTVVRLLDEVLVTAGAKPLFFPSTSINALFGSLATVKPDLTLIYWSPYFPNMSEYLTALLTSSQPVPNFTGFSSSRLDELASTLRQGDKPPETVEREIQRVLNEELPWIPLYMETPYYLVSKRIHGFKMSPVSVTQLTGIKIY